MYVKEENVLYSFIENTVFKSGVVNIKIIFLNKQESLKNIVQLR